MQYTHVSELYSRALGTLKNPPRGVPLPWMPKFTEYLGGLRPHEITLLCAPTGVGKTELLATLAAQIVASGVPVFAAPVETGDVDFTSRVISTIAKQNLNHGLPVPPMQLEEMDKNYGERIKKFPLFIANYDNRVKIEELAQVIDFAVKQDKVRIALLDNLNFFMEVTKAQDQLLAIDHAIHELVMFVKRVPIHIVLVVHPRKTEGGRVESEFDIKGSSTSVQECHNTLLFNRPTPKQIEHGHEESHRELVFKKIRKRGYYVNRPIWVAYENGFYSEVKDATEHKRLSSTARRGQGYVPPGSD